MKPSILFYSAVALALFAARSYGAAVASDNAGNYSSWSHGDNLGSGFGAWQFNNSVPGNTTTNSSFAGEFLGNSSANGNGSSGNINTGGQAFGIYANSNNTANAIRPFTAGGSNGQSYLGVGETFSISLDNGFLDTNAVEGFSLQNSSGTTRIEFYFKGGQSYYAINVGGTELSTNLLGNGIGFTADGLSLTYTQLANNAWTIDVTPNGGSKHTYSSSDFGAIAASDISQVRVFDYNPGSGGSSKDLYVNNLSVVPEPSSIALVLMGMAGGAWMLRTKRN